MLKKIAKRIIVTLLIVYVVACIVINIMYEQILTNKLGADEIVFNVLMADSAPNSDQYIVYLKDSVVSFCTITNKDITPSLGVYIPYIQKKCVVDPNHMTTVEGTNEKHPFFSDDEKIENGVVFRAIKLFSNHGMLSSSYIYFGLTDEEIKDYDLEVYPIDDIAEGKYIFMLESEERIRFDDFYELGM
ncbi:MAG: hypothetical protein MJA31_02490 [Clostridia bacterium]|nr:hypothetical protein [Clostridia bacterium]